MPDEFQMSEKDVQTWKKALQHPRWRNPKENGALYGFYHPKTNTVTRDSAVQDALDAGCIPHWTEFPGYRCSNWDQHLVQLVAELEQELRNKGRSRRDLPSPFGLIGWGYTQNPPNPPQPCYSPIFIEPDYLLCLWEFLNGLTGDL